MGKQGVFEGTGLCVVRVGPSEGLALADRHRPVDQNIAKGVLCRGSDRWHLTEEGERAIKKTGAFLEQEFPGGFPFGFFGPYLRAIETVALLGGVCLEWEPDFRLEQSHWMDPRPAMPATAQREDFSILLERFRAQMNAHANFGIFMDPSALRELVTTFSVWHRQVHLRFPGKTVIVVGHEETYQLCRVVREKPPFENYLTPHRGKIDDAWRLPPGGVAQFSETCPVDAGDVPANGWVRKMIPPSNDDPCTWTPWKPFRWKTYTAKECAAMSASYPDRLL